MIKISYLGTLLLFLFCLTSYSQRLDIKFGDISRTDLEMDVYKPDPGADAVVLSDCGSAELTYTGGRFQIEMERDVRIKIINKNGFGYANIEIPYMVTDNLTNIKASTFNLENGTIVETKLSKKAFIRDKENKYYYVLRIAFPNIYEGSIIEYRYRYKTNSIYQFIPWEFQSEIPVRHSVFCAKYPDFFNYRGLIVGDVSMIKKKSDSKMIFFGGYSTTENTHRWVGENIPAFREEPYITGSADHLIRIDFELAGVSFPGSNYEELTPSYLTLSKKLLQRDDFGIALQKTDFLESYTRDIIKEAKSDVQKLSMIHDFVSKKILWNSIDDYATTKPLKRVFNEERGNSAEINMILIAMLRQAGLKTDPVVLSTRDNGSLHPLYAMVQKFNYLVAHVQFGGKEYIVDATEPLLPFNNLPFKCLNDRGRLVNETDSKWINLSNGEKVASTSLATVSVNENGTVEGSIVNSYNDYAAFDKRKFIKLESLEGYKDYVRTKYSNWEVSEFQVIGIDSLTRPIQETFKLKINDGAKLTSIGLVFNPFMLEEDNENPFSSEERKFRIDFGCPIVKTYSINLVVPNGYDVEEKPSNVSLKLPDNGGGFQFSCEQRGNIIIVQSKYSVNKTRFEPEDYVLLREFFAQIMQKQSELIVLKKKI